jgi:hypothetical protein
MVRGWTRDRPSDPPATVRHALRVVETLRRQIPDVAPEVLAAVLLQDSEELAPTTVDLDTVLPALSPEVARLVWLLQHEHDELHAGRIPVPPVNDLPLFQSSAGDKLVTLRAVVAGAARAADPAAYWGQHQGLVAALPYFRAIQQAAGAVLPAVMVNELDRLLGVAEQGAGVEP